MTFTPGVVEPSFGIDRILFSVLEHSYYARPKVRGVEKNGEENRLDVSGSRIQSGIHAFDFG